MACSLWLTDERKAWLICIMSACRWSARAGCQYATLGCWGVALGNAGLCWQRRIWFGLKMTQWVLCYSRILHCCF